MTIRFLDSFSHYNTPTLGARKWNNFTNVSYTCTINVGGGRFSGNSFRLVTGGSNSSATGYFTLVLTSLSTYLIGFSIKFSSFSFNVSSGQLPIFLSLFDDLTTQIDLRIKTDGTIQLTRNGTILGTTTFALSTGTWYSVAFKVTINNTTGSYELRVNNDNKLSATGVNTRNSSNNTINTFNLGLSNGTGAGSATIDYSDFYVLDTTTSNNNDFLPTEPKIECLFPSGTGNYNQFTRGGSDSGANWDQVNETSPNDDTDYNYSNTINQIDTYNYDNLSSLPRNIYGVQVTSTLRKDNAGSHTIGPIIRISGTDYQVASNDPAYDTYTTYIHLQETDPSTSGIWTKTNIDAMECGLKILS